MFDDHRLTPEQRKEGSKALATVFVAFEDYIATLVDETMSNEPNLHAVSVARAGLVTAALAAVQLARQQHKERTDG